MLRELVVGPAVDTFAALKQAAAGRRQRTPSGLRRGKRDRAIGNWSACSHRSARPRAIRNRGITGLEVLVVAEEIPAIGILEGPADIVRLVVPVPGLAGLQRYNRIELPAFQQLCRRFLPWKGVRRRKSEAMGYVEVAARIFAARVRAVLRKELANIVGIVVERMRVSVAKQ